MSDTLIRHPAIRKVTFTGSIAVGKQLAQLAAAHGLKPCTLELGGHAPVIVCADADPEAAAQTCAAGRFRNAGQVCVAPSRFLVHASQHDAFVQALTRAANALVLGDGLDPATTMGPLANARRLAAMQRYVDDAHTNTLPYGLSAYAFTASARTTEYLARHLAAGLVGINHFAISLAEAPFGGIRESGYGVEGGQEGLHAYLTPRFVSRLLR